MSFLLPRLLVATALLLLPAGALHAQGEDELRAALVGKEVEVLIDMPATKDGIDFHPERTPQIDFDDYFDRIADYGIAITEGSTARITQITVKGKHIEFHLDGGGYGTFGDESVPSTHVSRPPKTQRELDLEARLRTETDPAERSRLQRELDRLSDDRERRYQRDRADAEYKAEEARRRISRARLLKGSRFNVRYDRDVPAQLQTPGGLMAVLSEYVRDPAVAETEVAFPDPDSAATSVEDPNANEWPLPVWKGLTRPQVDAVFGAPSSCEESMEGSLATVTCRYELAEADVEAMFVADALVRYTISSR